MKMLKKLIALGTVFAMLGATVNVEGQEYVTEVGGYGYDDSYRAPLIAPAVALGTIALVAIIAVAIQNSDSGHHGHFHE